MTSDPEKEPTVRIYKNPAKDRDLSMGIGVAGTGGVKPPKQLHDEVIQHYIENFDEERAGKPFSQMRREKLGTEVLHQTTTGYTIEDCMVDAAKLALDRAGMTINDIAEIHISTISPTDKIAKSRSKVIEKLGAETKPVIELAHACAGSLYALESARRCVLVKGKPVLAIAGDDVRQYVLNLKDWAQAGIFGAGVGAAVLEPTEEGKGLSPLNFWTDTAITPFANMNSMTEKFHMEGKKLGQLAPATYHTFFNQILEEFGIPKDKAYVIPHQLNGHLIELFRQQAGLEKNQVLNIVNQFGNTSNGSVLLALDHAVRNRLKPGDYGLLFAVGAGFDFGYTILKPDRNLIENKTVRVLTADDDQDMLESKMAMYEMMLNEHPDKPDNVTFEYKFVKSGEEAIKVAQEWKPNILDFDQRMGDLSGSMAAREIHEQNGPIPTIIHSGYSDNRDWNEFGGLKLKEEYKAYKLKSDVAGEEYLNFMIDFMYKTNIL